MVSSKHVALDNLYDDADGTCKNTYSVLLTFKVKYFMSQRYLIA